MKRIISIICVLTILFSFAVLNTSAIDTTTDYIVSAEEGADKSSAEGYVYGYIGDVDYDNEVSVMDATGIQRHIAQIIEYRDTNLLLADVDMDGEVGIIDATQIQMWCSKHSVKAPVYHLLSTNAWGAKHKHYYKIVSVPASCFEDGYWEYVCECDENTKSTYTIKTSDAIGIHNYGDWEIYKEPTADEYGENRSYCKNCDDYKTMITDKIRDNESSLDVPYFVSLEYVSETRPNTFYVDGTDVLSRVYGKPHYAYQKGDTITYRINMSDGGSKGFDIAETFGCNAKISGKNVIITISGSADSASVGISVNTKNGTKNVWIEEIEVFVPSGDRPLANYRSALVKVYASNIGLKWVNGYNVHSGGEQKIVSLDDMFNVMDEAKNNGCTKYDYSVDTNEFYIIVGN